MRSASHKGKKKTRDRMSVNGSGQIRCRTREPGELRLPVAKDVWMIIGDCQIQVWDIRAVEPMEQMPVQGISR